MQWLNSITPANADPTKQPGTLRGPCSLTAGKSENVMKEAPWTEVKFSNVKSGEIGSTFKAKACATRPTTSRHYVHIRSERVRPPYV